LIFLSALDDYYYYYYYYYYYLRRTMRPTILY